MARNDAARSAGKSLMNVNSGVSKWRRRHDPEALKRDYLVPPYPTQRPGAVKDEVPTPVHVPNRDKKRYADGLLRFQVCKRDGYKCRYCGTRVNTLTCNIDHVTPWLKGGRTVLDNLVTACQDCNKRKGNGSRMQPQPLE